MKLFVNFLIFFAACLAALPFILFVALLWSF